MRWIVAIGLGLCLAAGSGCATLDKTDEEVLATYRQAFETDMRQLSHSWNKLWLADRPYPLSEWQIR